MFIIIVNIASYITLQEKFCFVSPHNYHIKQEAIANRYTYMH